MSFKTDIGHEIKHLEEEISCFRQIIKLSQDNGYRESILRGLIYLAKERLSQHITEGVEEVLLEALEIGQTLDADDLLEEIYRELEKFYEMIGNWEVAYRLLKNREENGGINKALSSKVNEENITTQLHSYKRLYNQMKMISKVGQRFTASLEIDETLDMIYGQVNQLVSADIVGLGMRKKSGKFLYKAYGANGNILDVNRTLYDKAVALGKFTIQQEDNIIVNDGNFGKYFNLIKDFNYNPVEKGGIQSALFTRLKIDGVSMGMIGVGNYSKNAYTENDLRSLQVLGSYIAVALRNAELFNEVTYFAMYDTLTGIYNRGTVLRLAKEQFLKNNVVDEDTAIIMLDIDHFKTINDRYGHVFGDTVLKELGTILKQGVRSNDFLGRYGGEEFIVVLNNVSLEIAAKIAERLHSSVKGYEFVNDNKERVPITVSSGVYLCHRDEEFETGIKRADKALYDAKIQGRNRVVIYKES